jgi:hypothetical protein
LRRTLYFSPLSQNTSKLISSSFNVQC